MLGIGDAIVILGLGLFVLEAINYTTSTVEECVKAKYNSSGNDTWNSNVIGFDYAEDNDNE